MAKSLSIPKTIPTLQESLEELEKTLPTSGDYLRMLLDETEVYDSQEARVNRERTLDFLNSQLGEILDSLSEEIDKELGTITDIDEKAQAKQCLVNVFKSLARERPISSDFLYSVFSSYWGPEKSKRRHGKEYKVVNLIISATDETRLLTACGLIEDSTGGKGAHTKWIDPLGQMEGTHVTSPNGKIWLSTRAKELYELRLPLERIKAGFEKCGYTFTINIDNDEE